MFYSRVVYLSFYLFLPESCRFISTHVIAHRNNSGLARVSQSKTAPGRNKQNGTLFPGDPSRERLVSSTSSIAADAESRGKRISQASPESERLQSYGGGCSDEGRKRERGREKEMERWLTFRSRGSE